MKKVVAGSKHKQRRPSKYGPIAPVESERDLVERALIGAPTWSSARLALLLNMPEGSVRAHKAVRTAQQRRTQPTG